MAARVVRVRLFANLRDVAGTSALELELVGEDSVESCWLRLCDRFQGLTTWRESVRPARNLEYAEWGDSVVAGDELAFLPPVSGGAATSEPMVEVKVGPEAIDEADLSAGIEREGIGAVATFVGLVRDPDQGHPVSHLIYEAYPEMAEPVLREICIEACQRFGAREARVRHRTGEVVSGATSVAVAVGAAHRRQALDACSYIIDELKSRAPIWKSED
ncbi:MAG: molybdenum cofactor biosynthesis protein MoaE [Candidatus Dormiibacterota bacterium]